jgi:hypothetical protein
MIYWIVSPSYQVEQHSCIATITVRDVCNFVRRVVEKHGNSLFHTPNIFSTVFRIHICATLYPRCGRVCDQLLVSLDIGGMDNRYHQVIYSGYHHVQTVHICDYCRIFWHHVCYLVNVRQCLKCLNLTRNCKQLEHLSRSILFDF